MASLILSVIGSDRPGLTQALAAAVLSAGGNWLESQLSRLGGLYVGSVLVDLAPDRIQTLRSAVQAVDSQGLEVRIAPALEGAVAQGDEMLFSLVGQARPGIVHQVTAVLSGLGVNIEDFDTRISAEPYSGGALFHLDARLRLPIGLAADEVQTALEAISGEVMVDFSLSPARAR